MRRLFSPRSWRRLATATAACLLTAASAAAQVGTAATPLTIQAGPAFASIGLSGSNQVNAATSAGGVTLFSAYAPNGPLLARLPLPPPHIDPDSVTPDPWIFGGVPPGTYYVALVYGIVNAPAIPATAWTQLVVPGACTGAPGVGLVERRSINAEPNTVRLFLSTFGGCATSYLVEAGTSPGAANVASLETPDFVLSAAGVPAGSYYVRVRGRNQFGIGPYSQVLPVSVPDCTSEWTQQSSNVNATIVGHQVTLTWTPTAPSLPPERGGPFTFYELALLSGRPPGAPLQPFLIPITTTSVSASLPSGTYDVVLITGNACTSEVVGGVTFTVP